jgi:hypothetical protein
VIKGAFDIRPARLRQAQDGVLRRPAHPTPSPYSLQAPELNIAFDW